MCEETSACREGHAWAEGKSARIQNELKIVNALAHPRLPPRLLHLVPFPRAHRDRLDLAHAFASLDGLVRLVERAERDRRDGRSRC